MTNIDLIKKINDLDDDIKTEAMNFIDFLIQKKKSPTHRRHPKAGFLENNTFVIKEGFDEIPEAFEDYLP